MKDLLERLRANFKSNFNKELPSWQVKEWLVAQRNKKEEDFYRANLNLNYLQMVEMIHLLSEPEKSLAEVFKEELEKSSENQVVVSKEEIEASKNVESVVKKRGRPKRF